ncbi:MAG TPA: hypothetical protein VJ736_12390, partial [Actinomycetota bacterium]|nr:hypothetical protein [Actinomycetota bacterium]
MASVVVLACVAVASFAGAPPAPAAPTIMTYTLDPDLRLTATRLPNKPLEVRTLTITPAADAVPDIEPLPDVHLDQHDGRPREG